MVVFAKCIQPTQIAENRLEFMNRQNENHIVYCAGETTTSKITRILYFVSH